MSRPAEDREFEQWRASGDPEAIARALDRTAPKLLLLASHWARNGTDAEDLLQTTFLHALRDRAQWDARKPLLPWLASILVHRALDTRRLACIRAHEELPADSGPGRGPEPAQQAIEAELLERITAAVDALPRRYREVLVLRLAHGIGPTKIAHALGRAPVTVRKQLERGLALLRRALPAGFAVPALLVASGPALAAMRGKILAQAQALVPQAGAAAALAPAVATSAVSAKKLAIAAVALAGAVLLGVALWSTEPPAGTRIRDAAPPAPVVAALPQQDEAPPPAPATREAVAPAEAALDPKLGALRARVIWERDGTPAVGVGVEVLVRERANWLKHPILGTTDASGSFECRDLEPGVIYVSPDRANGIEAQARAGEWTDVLVSIPRGTHVDVLVLDRDADPVPGAGIWLSDYANHSKGSVVARTDQHGRCRLRDVGPARYVAARMRGFAGSSAHYLQHKPDVEVSVVLRLRDAGGSVKGHVVDTGGKPIPRARVRVTPSALPQERDEVTGQSLSHAPPFELTADESGAFEAQGLAAGRAILLASARDCGDATAAVEVAADASVECLLVLPAAARIRGRVLDERGMFVAQALVAIEGIHALNTRTDAAGTFELVGVTPGKVSLRCVKADMQPSVRTLQVLPGSTAEIELGLAPGQPKPELRGRLLDESGRAVSGWWISAGPLDQSKTWRAHAESDAEGKFTLQLREAVPCRIQAGSERYQHMPAVWIDSVPPHANPVELRLPAGWQPASLHARITDERGAPISGAHVSLMHWQFGAGRAESTETDGSFAIDSLTTMGEYRLQIRAAGHPWHERVLHVAPGQRLDLGTIVLPQGGSLLARIAELGGGSPPIDCLHDCRVVAPDGRESGGLVHERGTLRCPHLAPGRHVLQLRHDSHALAAFPFEITSGRETTLDCTLLPGVRRRLALALPPALIPSRDIRVTILDANDLPLWQERNIVFPGDERPIRISPVLANGAYTVRAESRGQHASASLVVTEVGQPTLPPEQTLTLR